LRKVPGRLGKGFLGRIPRKKIFPALRRERPKHRVRRRPTKKPEKPLYGNVNRKQQGRQSQDRRERGRGSFRGSYPAFKMGHLRDQVRRRRETGQNARKKGGLLSISGEETRVRREKKSSVADSSPPKRTSMGGGRGGKGREVSTERVYC